MSTEPAYVLGMFPAAGMTADELLHVPDKHAELVRGALVVREPPGLRHGRIAMEIGAALAAHVRANQLGRVYVESGFKLMSNPDTVRGPDVAFVSESRLPEPEPVGYPALAPDLVVEILSPGDRPGGGARQGGRLVVRRHQARVGHRSGAPPGPYLLRR